LCVFSCQVAFIFAFLWISITWMRFLALVSQTISSCLGVVNVEPFW
jgi:hypothetical protein